MGDLRGVIKDLNVEDFSEFLLEKGVHEEVASLFVSNRISGSIFLKLSEGDLKEIIPTIGDRILVKELLNQVSQVIFYTYLVATVLNTWELNCVYLQLLITLFFITFIGLPCT